MKWSGLNRTRKGYAGELLDVDAFLADIASIPSLRPEWELHWLSDTDTGVSIPVLTSGQWKSGGLYLSAGIHGDEPASPLAALKFLREFPLPPDFSCLAFPLINPTGMRLGTRDNDRGSDLNREFNNPRSWEVKAVLSILEQCGRFDQAVFLHEDWEAQGFYLYQLHRQGDACGRGAALLDWFRSQTNPSIPIDESPVIDERDNDRGLIDTAFEEHLDRPEWPEAFFLNAHHTDITYTLESPSDLDLPSRVEILSTALAFLIES